MTTGVIATYREKFILLRTHCVTDEEFVLLDYCNHCADFDENHKEKFGTFELTNKDQSSGIGWSEDKTGRNLKKLLNKGFLKRVNKNKIEVVDFSRYLPKYAFDRTKNGEEIAYLRGVIAGIRPENAELQPENANLREKEEKIATKTETISDISSSKVNVNIPRSFRSYKEIKEKNGYTVLTEEDMRWIDENVLEENAIQK